jgi:uncharacterized membrane protein
MGEASVSVLSQQASPVRASPRSTASIFMDDLRFAYFAIMRYTIHAFSVRNRGQSQPPDLKQNYERRKIHMKHARTRALVTCAMIAALYTALCLALAPFSYGMVQIRAAEALTILPVFSVWGVWGITLGCFLSNLIGFFMGANPLVLDMVVGTAATLMAALLSRALRNIRLYGFPVLSALPPVLVNAVFLGLEFTYLETGGFSLPVFLLNAAYIAAGQAVACIGLGLPLAYVLERTGVAKKLSVTD